MKTTLIFVRHGQSKYNRSRNFTGQQDVPLTALGREQAERTAVYLDRFPITRIYSSNLIRAMQTAEPTAARHGLPYPLPVGRSDKRSLPDRRRRRPPREDARPGPEPAPRTASGYDSDPR